MVYGSPELKQETVDHYGGLVMPEGLFERANNVKANVERAVDQMPIHIKAMGGGDLAELMAEMADLLSALAYELEGKNGK